jgi:hypothetical protein
VPLLDDDFRSRLSAIVNDPQPMFPQSDPATEKPFLALCDLFLAANHAQRADLRRQWPFGRMWRIPSPGTTLDRPGGELSERRLTSSMLASALEAHVVDSRDIVVGLPIDYWVAKQLGLDPDALFRRIADLAIPAIKTILLEFVSRPAALKSPEPMGWRAVDAPNGRRWKPI